MPDLVARLSGLHSTLTARMSLQESLLSLNGRLDMVLSQIELRSSTAPASSSSLIRGRSSGSNANQKRQPTRYVEGESESDEPIEADIEVDSGDEGSVEDVQLGGDSDEEDEEEESAEESDSEGSDANGFIDDEAEEEYETDSGDESD